MRNRLFKVILCICCIICGMVVFNFTSVKAAETDVSAEASSDTLVQPGMSPAQDNNDAQQAELTQPSANNTSVEEAANTTNQQDAVTADEDTASIKTAPKAQVETDKVADLNIKEDDSASESTSSQLNEAPSNDPKEEQLEESLALQQDVTVQKTGQNVAQPNEPTTQLRAATATDNATTTQPTTSKRTILHTNDMHGRIVEEDGSVIGMPKLKTLKEQTQPDLMVDAGDAFQGLPLSNQSKGEEMAKAMNEVGYDAMTAGNHEFDFGYDQLKKLEGMLNFPIVSANVYKDGELAFQPSTVIEKNGLNYGVIGVTTPETKTKTSPNGIEGITFEDPLPSVTREMDRLNGQVDTFVILSHLGIDETTPEKWRGDYLTQQLSQNKAYQVPIFVIDGHSHTVLENGQTYGQNILAQTGTALANVGQIAFNHNKGQIDQATASLISVEDAKDIQPNAALQAQVDKANQAYLEETSKVILPNNTIEFNGERDQVRTGKTNLGNAIADAMEAYGQDGFSHPSDFAVTNSGGIRASISKGEVTLNDIITVLPFGNTIAQVQVKGSDVLKAFEHSLGAQTVEKDGQKQLAANGGLLQISNAVRVYYDIDQEAGQRIREVQVLNRQTHQFEPLDLNRTYYIATNDFTASGGDGFDMLVGPREEGVSLDQVFAEYLESADLSQYETTEATRMINGEPNAIDTSAQVDPSVDASTSTNDIETSVSAQQPTVTTKAQATAQNVIPFPGAFILTEQASSAETSTSMPHVNQANAEIANDFPGNMKHDTSLETHTNGKSAMDSNMKQVTNGVNQFNTTAPQTQYDQHQLPDTGTTQNIPVGAGIVLIGAGLFVIRQRQRKVS